MTTPKSFLCFLHGHGHRWEAICTDFDISVTGRSMAEVQKTLELAVQDYLVAARQESPEDCARLMRRKSPFMVRAALIARVALHAVFGRSSMFGDPEDQPARFAMPCQV